MANQKESYELVQILVLGLPDTSGRTDEEKQRKVLAGGGFGTPAYEKKSLYGTFNLQNAQKFR